ncbi:MAG: hypothetical protein HY236_14345 [Acidobacteria bacterium]|nr:hypothetical protein [Acidobacteriota bacterium]
MTAAVLDNIISSRRVWLQLPGVAVTDLRRSGIDLSGPQALRRRLELGLAADPDPRREHFYEAVIDGHRFYFHVLPRQRPGAKVWLLARWPAT